MKDNRPKNLNLTTVKFPVTAISSILHRIAGVILFFALPILLWALQKSFNPIGFAELQDSLNNNFFCQFVFWGILSALAFHVIAGVRHLLMDLGIGETLEVGKRSAWGVIILSAIAALLLGLWILGVSIW